MRIAGTKNTVWLHVHADLLLHRLLDVDGRQEQPKPLGSPALYGMTNVAEATSRTHRDSNPDRLVSSMVGGKDLSPTSACAGTLGPWP